MKKKMVYGILSVFIVLGSADMQAMNKDNNKPKRLVLSPTNTKIILGVVALGSFSTGLYMRNNPNYSDIQKIGAVIVGSLVPAGIAVLSLRK